jgi:hypothetical protein
VTLHFIHIGKTGGTAIKHILKRSGNAHWPGEAPDGVPETPYGRIMLHPHRFKLKDVPEGDFAFFCLRDPIDRFFSAWYSRQTEGRPRYFFPWTDEERRAYELYATPQALVADLAAGSEQAAWVMDQILHVRPMAYKLVWPHNLERELPRIAYIAKQETLDQDFENLKVLLGLPERLHLPRGKASHRAEARPDKSLDDAGRKALQRYYKLDYKLLARCEEVRVARGWASALPAASPG